VFPALQARLAFPLDLEPPQALALQQDPEVRPDPLHLEVDPSMVAMLLCHNPQLPATWYMQPLLCRFYETLYPCTS
jgi:hypothetical protein